MSPEQALREVFGHPGFRPGQAEAVSALLAGRDVQVLLPTGGGKSLCYQVPALVGRAAGRGPVLVVSPLIALMDDQVAALRRRGVTAEAFHSGVPAEDRKSARDGAARAALLYASPERVAQPRFRAWLRALGVWAVAIDEAHCISEWGHDFRPEYRELGALKRELDLPTIAVTATATPRVLDEIRGSLGLRDPLVVRGSFRRPNLEISVELHEGDRARTARVLALLQELGLGRDPAKGRAVVYAATRARVRGVADALKKAGIKAGWYHAGRTDGARAKAQEAFEEGRHVVLVATTAFGMGIDHPDVRLVAHVQAPGSLESWYQQAGRAGRDGAPARCVLLYAPGDAVTQARLRGTKPAPGAEAGWTALQDLVYGAQCRQAAVERWFGEVGEPCGTCDVCRKVEVVVGAVQVARERLGERREAKAAKRRQDAAVVLDDEQLDVILAFVGALAKPVGKGVIAAGLRGSKARKVLRLGLAKNPCFGALADLPELAIVNAVEDLLAEGRLAPRGKKYPTVWLPEKKVRAVTPGARPRATGLAAALKAFRSAEARRRKWKAYQIFPNATLAALTAARPRSLEALEAIPGLGPKRIERFGSALLQLIAQNP